MAALRSTSYLKQLANRLGGRNATYATSTSPKLKAYAPTADFQSGQDLKPSKKWRRDFVAVYVAIGMIALSATMGLKTALLHLKDSPTVRVNKKRRESLPEVEEPERVVEETDRFLKRSLFRKVAHVQENDTDYAIKDPTRADIYAHTPVPRPETLESVGVNPKFRVIDG